MTNKDTTPTSGAADLPEARLFTKKPVTIAAIQWTGKNLREVIAFTEDPPGTRTTHAGMAWEAYTDLVAHDGLKIYTLEGTMLASPGDWIIRGVKGEYYPCKPDIFEATYSPAALAAGQATAAQPAPAGTTEPTEQQILEAAFAPAQPAAEASRFGSPELQAMIIARCVEKDQADSVPAVEREQERIAFKDAHRHLELDEVPDAWGRPMFKHSHVEASWLGWIARASHGQAPAGASKFADVIAVQRGEAESDPSDAYMVGLYNGMSMMDANYRNLPDWEPMGTMPKPSPTAQAAGSVPAVSDLPPLPDPDLRDVGTKPQDVKDFLNGYATEYARLALAARDPAESVTALAGGAAELLKEILAEACCEESETNLTGDHYRRLYDLQSRIQAMLSTPPAR